MKNETELMKSLAMDSTFSARQASRLLREYKHFRTLWEKLTRYTDDPETLRSVLVDGLAAYHPEMQRASIDRNVRNWMNDRTIQTIARRTAIEICFILKLDLNAADELLAFATDERFHWRDPHECALAFALAQSMSYQEACRLEERAVQAAVSGGASKPTNIYTEDVRNDLLQCDTTEDMLAYVAAHAERFSEHRNTAFKLFDKMIALLELPENDNPLFRMPSERKMTIRDILHVYLHRDLVPVKKRSANKQPAQTLTQEQTLTQAQKALITQIRTGWPDESTLSKNRAHTEDVSRKTLLLLFLATDGGQDPLWNAAPDSAYPNDENLYAPAMVDSALDEAEEMQAEPDELSRDDQFEQRLLLMNLMLSACGYRTIDPRSAFDWMVLYVLNVDASYESNDKLDDLLIHFFPPQSQ